MSSRRPRLAAHRRRLAAESQVLRLQLGADLYALRGALNLADIAHSWWVSVHRHPLAALATATAILALGPRRILLLARLGLIGVPLLLRAATALRPAARRPSRAGHPAARPKR